MAELYPVAGMKISIGGPLASKKADLLAADFADEDWEEIDGWETMGSVGDSNALITTALINRNRDVKLKGTANAGSFQCNFAIISDDPGQLALIAASKTKRNYAFMIEGNDAPATGASPKPSRRYFIGLVMGTPEQGGGANTAQMMQATIEINSNVVKVAPSAT